MALLRQVEPEQVDERGQDVRHVLVLAPDAAGVRRSGAASESTNGTWLPPRKACHLVEPEGRVARHRPAARVVRPRRRAAHQRHSWRGRSRGSPCPRARCRRSQEVRRSARAAALTRGAVVAREEERPCSPTRRAPRCVARSRPTLWSMLVDHRGVHLHVAGEERLLVAARASPRRRRPRPGSGLRGGSSVSAEARCRARSGARAAARAGRPSRARTCRGCARSPRPWRGAARAPRRGQNIGRTASSGFAAFTSRIIRIARSVRSSVR